MDTNCFSRLGLPDSDGKRFFKILWVVAILALYPSLLSAQTKRTDDFKNRYQLKEVVVLSRHNIRAPLSTKGSVLEEITSHPWHDWSAAASELTCRGGALETMNGLFFRKWLVGAGLFPENAVPTQDEVNIYANSMQRCIATAHYFTAAFLPVANVRVNHRFTPSKMDPVFFPRLTKAGPRFEEEALKQIAAFGGSRGIVGINEGLKESYDITARVLDLKDSPACKSGQICAFDDYNTRIILKKGDEPKMKGSLKVANTASDAFILQYYEEPDEKKAAFGHDLTIADWEKIAKIKDVYGDVLFSAPIVAVNVAHPLLVYLYDELNADNRKFTFLCGHDSNLASVAAALGVEDYELPYSIEKKTPIGSKMVIEKWADREGKLYVAINLVYQSTAQLRNIELLTPDNPPMIFQVSLKGLSVNTDGLYTLDAVNGRFMEAIRAYESIEDEQ
ncbi:putative glucose-1-phosphatase [Bacteroides pyogenes F0041]|uniref:Putative glucose-1-phosphatase n=1 Tax=Bacteroides pyogenes F0041 TaxID=1321819 RepID=U2CPZ9_9BACE|nr:histidine-type phosphatase [Bacteroides pyogenes]ERI86615.1 putative glucose-1-phosphatase [Bacteroides pyogenes F0041]